MRIALTHSAGRLEELEARLVARGHEVVRTPLIEVRPRLDAATREAAAALLTLPWLLFASRSAVSAWSALELPFEGPSLGAVGEGTAAALERAGGRVRVLGEPATGRGLASAFLARRDARGPVGLPRGNRSRDDLRTSLAASGLPVRTVTLYDTTPAAWRGDERVEAVVLASPSAVQGLPDAVAERATLVALGPTTGDALRRRGLPARVAARPDVEAVLETIESLTSVRRSP